MESRRFQVLIDWDTDSGLWVTQVPALDLSTYGETREEALDATHEAILGYIEAAEKEGLPLAVPSGRAELVEIEVARA